jgi:hypothetical protein
MAGPFCQERINQHVVQYACRTTPMRELRPADKKSLFTEIQRVWPDLADGELPGPQLMQLQNQNQNLRWAWKKSLFLGGGTADISTVLLSNDTFTLVVPRMLNGQAVNLYKRDPWLKEETNSKARQVILKMQDILGIEVHRTGKIHELVFAPIMPEELTQLFEHLFGSLDERPSNVQGEFTFVRKVKGCEYNVNLKLGATPPNLDKPCPVAVRVYVNNRDMSKDLHPEVVSDIWAVGDAIMPEWLFVKLGGGRHE